ncbi:MAG: glycosyltransferase [Rhodospirillales bacterium]
MTPAKVAAIIPYFQRDKTLLLRAVRSVLAQEGVDPPAVVVVDDGSPLPAREALADLAPDERALVRLIEQPNAGPGAARNRGLAAMDPDVTYAAFLDSDDVWLPMHLRNAVAALDLGYDFYFADSREADRSQSHFEDGDGAVIRDLFAARPGVDGILFRDDEFFSQTVKDNLIGPSSVVFRVASFRDARFIEDLWVGEDRMFWLEILSRTRKVAVSTAIEVVMGTGISIYRSIDWGTEKSLRGYVEQTRMRKEIVRRFRLDAAQRRDNDAAIAELRQAFVLNVGHCLLHQRRLFGPLVARQVRQDPLTALLAAPIMVRRLIARVLTGAGTAPAAR